MNPPMRDRAHHDAIWKAVRDGIVDVLGSDHAPHTREEKDRRYPDTPSGMPGVQTLVPLLLDHVNAGRLTLERFVDLTAPVRSASSASPPRAASPSAIDADFTIVDLKAKRTIENKWIARAAAGRPTTARQSPAGR